MLTTKTYNIFKSKQKQKPVFDYLSTASNTHKKISGRGTVFGLFYRHTSTGECQTFKHGAGEMVRTPRLRFKKIKPNQYKKKPSKAVIKTKTLMQSCAPSDSNMQHCNT